MGGIYKIINLINGKSYVGSTISSFNRRWNCHKSTLRRNLHKNKYLQRSWNKHGENNFKFEIVEEIINSSREVLIEREKYYTDILKSKYNIAPIDRPLGTMNKGRKHTIETREKMRLSHKNHKMPDWFGPYISKLRIGKNNPMYGKTGALNSKYAGLFMWENKNGKKEVLSQMEMVKKYNLLPGNLYRVVVGDRNHHRGWMCKGKYND